jgi:hypothetical protein
MATLQNPTIHNAFLRSEVGYCIRIQAITEVLPVNNTGTRFSVYIGNRRHTLRWSAKGHADDMSTRIASTLKTPYAE